MKHDETQLSNKHEFADLLYIQLNNKNAWVGYMYTCRVPDKFEYRLVLSTQVPGTGQYDSEYIYYIRIT